MNKEKMIETLREFLCDCSNESLFEIQEIVVEEFETRRLDFLLD